MLTPKTAGNTTGLPIPMTTVPRALRDYPTPVPRPPMPAAKPSYPSYQPTALVQKKEGGLLGVIVPAIGARHFPSLLRGLEQAASQAGFSIIICQSSDDVQLERSHVNTLLNAQVVGLLVAMARDSEDYRHFDSVNSQGIPLVHFGNAPANQAASSVITNDHSGGYQATRHLLDQGCTRIAHLAGPQHIASYRQRRQGYLDALASAGIAADEQLICYSDLQFEDGATAMRRLLSLPEPPTGVFGASHSVMAGALKVLKSRKIAVPQQMALASCSNEDACPPTTPALTSVDQLGEEMGRAAVGLLLEKVAAAGMPFVPRQVVLPPKLVMRGSSRLR